MLKHPLSDQGVGGGGFPSLLFFFFFSFWVTGKHAKPTAFFGSGLTFSFLLSTRKTLLETGKRCVCSRPQRYVETLVAKTVQCQSRDRVKRYGRTKTPRAGPRLEQLRPGTTDLVVCGRLGGRAPINIGQGPLERGGWAGTKIRLDGIADSSETTSYGDMWLGA